MLEELWDEPHTVRVGGGDGFVVEEDRLVWVGVSEIREARVSDLREAVVLARSWSLEPQSGDTLGWVPTLPPAPPEERTWVLHDLDWGPKSGQAWMGGSLTVDRAISAGIEVVWDNALSGRVRVELGEGFTEPRASVDPVSRTRFGSEVQLGKDLVPGRLMLVPGGVFESEHALSAGGFATTAGLAVELGLALGLRSLVLRAEPPPWLLAQGPGGATDALATELGLAIRQRSTIGWEVHGGAEIRERTPSRAPVEAFVRATLSLDLGGA